MANPIAAYPTRRNLIRSSLFAPALLAADTSRPNVLLFISDDQGFGDLSLHGNPSLSTPNLDRIAKQGVEFTQFHVNPVCSPTRSSLLTGRYYYRTGVVDTYLGRSMMYNDEVTLAEVLRGASYRTGIFGKWHLGDHYPLRPSEQGFEECLIHEGGGIAQPSDPPEGNSYFDPKLVHNGRPEQRRGYCTDIFFDAAMQFVEANRDKPFFAYLSTNAPHQPLQVDEKYVAPFRMKGLDETTSKTYGMIANLDENTGRLLAHLTRLGLDENTILIFLTDNGPIPARFNAGMRGIKGTVYQGGIRVPFFLRWPGVAKPGTQVDRLTGHIDVFPTLLEACGVPLPSSPKIDGASFLPLIRGSKTVSVNWPDRTLFFQWHRGDRGELYNNCAARTQRYKMVNGKELYDLQADPGEAKNIAAHQPEILAQLRSEYEAWFRDVAATRNFAPPRIYLGSAQENPVLLTRQDWRGPRASWAPDGLGFWEVDVRQPGDYQCTLLFPPAPASARANIRCGGIEASSAFASGATSTTALLKSVPAGASRLEAELAFQNTTVGPHYVRVRRI